MPAHVSVVLSLYRPDARFLSAQIESVLAQDHRDLTLFIVPDGPDAGTVGEIFDSRVRVIPQADRKGVALNFLRGLSVALAAQSDACGLFAFCDQDDVWLPRKLSTLVAAMAEKDAQMAYSDARIVAADGREISPSLFRSEGRQPHRDLTDLMIVNDVSGMSMLLTRACAERAVRVPPPAREPDLLHDWWVALIARATGTTVFVDEPLVDYRRHARNVVGPALDRPAKRPFLSRAYRDMCSSELMLRKTIWKRLRGVDGAELPPFGDMMSRMNLLRRLAPPGSQRARAALRLLIGRSPTV